VIAPSVTPKRVLMPGEWALMETEGLVETLLGSCVALTIWDPVTLVGACCHYLLPGTGHEVDDVEGKYGRRVIPAMLHRFRLRGIPPSRCVYKLFGGGRMFFGDVGDIGAQNILCARELLRRAGVALTAESVGDEGHRKIRLDVRNGSVEVEFHPLAGGPERISRS